MQTPKDIFLRFFKFAVIILLVTHSVNPQVPGSSPGRGAKSPRSKSIPLLFLAGCSPYKNLTPGFQACKFIG